MKKRIIQHAVPICILLCMAILAGSSIVLNAHAGAGTYRINDIEGDADYLDGIAADIVIGDSAHEQYVSLRNGKLSHEYEYTLPFPTSRATRYNSSQNYVEHEDADVNVTTNTNLEDTSENHDFYITEMRREADKVRLSIVLEMIDDNHRGMNVKMAQVVTDVVIQDDSKPFVFNLMQEKQVYRNQTTPEGEPAEDVTSLMPFDSNGIEIHSDDYDDPDYDKPLYAQNTDSTMYFTPNLRPFHQGESAIYRVDEWAEEYSQEPVEKDGYEYFPWYSETNLGSVTKVAAIPIDEHEMRTVHLSVIDNRLCLLLIIDGTLTMRVYGMDGTLESEAPLFDLEVNPQMHVTLYTNPSQGSTVLCYHMINALNDEQSGTDVTNDNKSNILVCVELGDTIKLRSKLLKSPFLLRAGYIDDYWVLVESKPDEPVYNTQDHPGYIPQLYMINILNDEGNTLYSGEIVTDAFEDNIQYYTATGEQWYMQNSSFTTQRWLHCDLITEDN